MMAKTNVQGICKLCQKPKVLCRSHYLGRALEALTREDGRNTIVMTPELATLSPRQLWAHLLCSECEQRLSRLGESTVLALLNGRSRFPLLELLKRSTPMKTEYGVTVFSGSDLNLDTKPFAYFALSLLWKGAIHDWKTIEGQTSSISLGPYEDQVRQYLAGESSFPDVAFVALFVCNDIGSQGTVYAPARARGNQALYSEFDILARGLWFRVYIGKRVPTAIKKLCCVKSARRVLFLKSCHRDFVDAGTYLLRFAKRSAKLARLDN